MTARFDAYSATSTAAGHADFSDFLSSVLPMDSSWSTKRGNGFHTFGNRLSYRDHTGTEVAALQWGGRQDSRVMIEVKGEYTPRAVEGLRTHFPHRCTRVDSCADFDAPRAFERLYKACRGVKKAHRIVGGKLGDWEDYPERGRTLMLGATTSATRARLYEKGLQPQYAHLNMPNWARLEIQVRPQKDEAKAEFSTLSPIDVWGASRWTRDLAAAVLKQHVDPHPAGTTYRLSDRDRALSFMVRQYGSHLVSLAADLGGWAELGLTLKEMLSDPTNGG